MALVYVVHHREIDELIMTVNKETMESLLAGSEDNNIVLLASWDTEQEDSMLIGEEMSFETAGTA